MSTKPNKFIFLADDDADDCMLFEDALREVSTSTELTTANDGVELINLMETSVPPPPDVIFLDLNMPRKNGFECLEQIRKTKKWASIPVVIFSTTGQEEMVKKVRVNLKAAQDRQNNFSNQKRKFREYQVGDHVYVRI